MAGFSTITGGIHDKVALLINNKKFSDVVFLVNKEGGECQTFYAHKLVLSMASEIFGRMFYDTAIVKPQIKLRDVNPDTFFKFLKYLYTDMVTFETMTETNELYNLAKKYGVIELGEKCLQYILKDEITLENLFAKYDCAMGENVQELLMVCRNFASCNTKSVFQSTKFVEASLPVVQDIIAQNHLNVDSELDVIHAILKWGRSECKRRGFLQDDCFLRDSISSLLKHIRFLTLTAQQFCDFVEEHNIFSGHECTILTTKILQPDNQIKIPDIFCSSTTKRLPYFGGSKLNMSKENEKSDNYNMYKESDALLRKSNVSSTDYNIRWKQMKTLDYCDDDQKDSSAYHGDHQALFENPLSKSFQNVQECLSSLKLNAHNFENANVLNNDHTISQHVKKTESATPPVLRVQPCNFFPKQEFAFDMPLYPMHKGFKYAFENDIKCIAQLKMIRGAMTFYGIELKIKNRAKDADELEVFLSLSGFLDEATNEVCEKELKDDVLQIKFPKPQKLLENKKALIEVTVESLRLDRCSICPESRRRVELNCGLSTMSEVFLTSNQTTDEGVISFISRIIYAPSAR